MSPRVPEPLRRFIWDIQSMVELADDPREILLIGGDLMGRLVAASDWLPEAFALAGDAPRLYELYRDDMERFCVVASVLAPGQGWPLFADQVWEIRGVLRGGLSRQSFRLLVDAAPEPMGGPVSLAAGQVETARARDGQGTRLADGGGGSIVIQVFGGDIGRLPRLRIAADGSGVAEPMGYANPETAPAYDILTIQAEIVD